MELKNYQQRSIKDLMRYLELLGEKQDMIDAYKALWEEKGVRVGMLGLQPYQNLLPGVPNVCFKVPTGGGKTFMAAASIKPVFGSMPGIDTKAVVWLVPSDAILEQTLKNLKDTHHPYRQRINADFNGNVEVYSKAELLSGQNFNPTSVREQLSIMVLSYDSFRANKKEGRKAYQENSNLAQFQGIYDEQGFSIDGADETALFQVINTLNPYVIVDESHHAKTDLSAQMLSDFNPCFVLELTATPKDESNLISITDAYQLKREHMVKLPLIVYNRKSQEDVIVDAIDLRKTLERQASLAQERGGEYIRPIVLFQAQPKKTNDATTFEKVKEKLVHAGIPEEEIALKTANRNELRGIDLKSPECPIRYIITVNALKEGWDCPFAYVLASLANKTSRVDVEQIVGRVLRQPGARKNPIPCLNMAYVLASSVDFQNTVDSVVDGLNNAGFSKDDYRVGSMAEVEEDAEPQQKSVQLAAGLPFDGAGAEPEDEPEFDPDKVKHFLDERSTEDKATSDTKADGDADASGDNVPTSDAVAKMIAVANKEQKEYEDMMRENEQAPSDLPAEIASQIPKSRMAAEFEESAKALRIPQFVIDGGANLFYESSKILLDPSGLCSDFTLAGKPTNVNFAAAEEDIYRVDITDKSNMPQAMRIRQQDQKAYMVMLSDTTRERRIELAKSVIHGQLNRMDEVSSDELKKFIDHVLDFMDDMQKKALERNPYEFGLAIKKHIEKLLDDHKREQFFKWTKTGRISCEPMYELPPYTAITDGIEIIPKGLYEIEASMNGEERSVIEKIAALDNVVWWHRIIERKGFRINGFINHYPDFIVYTKSDKLVVVEVKGEMLNGTPDTLGKIDLGKQWESDTPNDFQYYMVFQDNVNVIGNAMRVTEFLDLLTEM